MQGYRIGVEVPGDNVVKKRLSGILFHIAFFSCGCSLFLSTVDGIKII